LLLNSNRRRFGHGFLPWGGAPGGPAGSWPLKERPVVFSRIVAREGELSHLRRAARDQTLQLSWIGLDPQPH
jgi:hypothetical protein